MQQDANKNANNRTKHKPEIDYKEKEKNKNWKVAMQVDRRWSRNMAPPKCAHSGPLAKVKAEHHRHINSEGDVGPRLVRSSGIRKGAGKNNATILED